VPSYSQETERDTRICKRVVLKLTRLKRLEIKGLSQIHQSFIEKLDSSPEFLSSLDKLRLVCEPHLTNNPILEIIRKYKTLLGGITSFVTNPLEGYPYCKGFQMLGRSLPNLESLQLGFSYGCYKFVNYLGAIGTFKNLKVVNFEIGNVNIFVRDFVLPDSVKSLRLHLSDNLSNIEVNETSMPRLKWKAVNFPENKALVRFYENFDRLKGLENLEMKFRNSTDPEDYKCLFYFTEGLLKRVSSLKSLSWLSPWNSWDREGNYSPFQKSIKESYFPQILSSLRSSGETLETLVVGHDRIIFSNLDFSECAGMFKRLSTVKITGKLEDDGLKDQLYLLLNEVTVLGEEITTIKLCTVTENKVESLLSVLRQIKKLQRPGKLQIELEIRFSKGKDLEEVNFENVMEELKKEDLKVEGVSLTLFTKILSGPMGEFLRMYGEKFDRFQNLPKFLGS